MVTILPTLGESQTPTLPPLPDPQFWVRYEVKTLCDVLSVGKLLPFPNLRAKFKFLGWMLFCFFQLSHATHVQFPTPPSLAMDPIEKLLAQESLTDPCLLFN